MNKTLENKLNMHYVYMMYFLLLFAFMGNSVVSYARNTMIDNSANGFLQQIQTKKISVSEKNKSLREILVLICKTANIKYGIKTDVILNDDEHYNLEMKNVTIEEVLNRLFQNTPYTYSLENDIITVVNRPKDSSIGDKKNITIKGHVFEQGGKTSIPGAAIMIVGTIKGVIADMGGAFTITANPGDVLRVSCVGKKTKMINVYEGISYVKVELEDDVKQMEDVYVTGYGNIKRYEKVGAIEKISGDELSKNANQTISQMLQGKIAGMVVTNNSGLVGTRQTIKIRGTSTLLGNQEPVWVVDGMIQEDPIPFKTTELNAFGAISEDNIDMIRNFVGNAISWLNPNDIKDITVLKDASATAIYGVKAANGVIVITTKRGTVGDMSVNYAGNFSFNQRSTYDKLNLMNSKERVDVSREIIQNGYISNSQLSDIGYEGAYKKYMNREISYEEFNRQAKLAETNNTNWLDLLMRNSMSNSHSLSLSGGSERINYYSSVGYSHNNGEAKDNDMSNYTANLNLNAWLIPEKLSLSSRLSGSYSKTSGVMVDAYNYAISTSRAIPAYNEDGSRYFYPKDGNTRGFVYNFENERDNSSNTNTTLSVNGSLSARWLILRGLDFDASLGFSSSTNNGTSYLTERTYAMTLLRGYEYGAATPSDELYRRSRLPHGGQYNYMESKNYNYTMRAQLSYNTLFNNSHRINASIGYEMRSSKYDGYSEIMYGYIHDRGRSFNLPPQLIEAAASNLSYVRNDIYDSFSNKVIDKLSNYISAYLTAGYSYKERYVVSGSVRSDASNRFGQNQNAKFLPVFAFGARWNMSEETWMKNQTIVNNLSLRGSYGWQGNVAENFGPDLIANVVGTPDQLTGEYYMTIKSLPYEDLRWEKVKTYNLGADFGLFKNQFQLSFNYYYKHTEDMIVNLNVPMSFGVVSMPINGGKMDNSGWDLTVTTTPIRTNSFVWNLTFNTAKNYNKIKSTLEPKRDWRTAVSGQLTKKGYAYSSVWGFEYLGLNPKNGAPLHVLPDVDNADFNEEDATTFMKHLGKLEPDFTGGLTTSFSYKSLSLSASFTMSVGSVRFLTNYVSNYTGLPVSNQNMSHEFVDRWRNPGDENNKNVKPALVQTKNREYQKIVNGQYVYNYEMYNYSDERLVNANFFKCNGITMNYTIPSQFLNRYKIKNLAINAGISNPFKLVSKDFKGIDPEVATGSSPILKSYTFGINVTL